MNHKLSIIDFIFLTKCYEIKIFMMLLSGDSCTRAPRAQPESSITIYIVEREFAYFVHMCHHSLHWLRLLTQALFSGPSHSHILSFHVWPSTFMFQGTTLKVPQKVSLANIGQNLFSHNSAVDWARDLFKPSKDVEWLLDSILKNLRSFGLKFFVGGVIIEAGLEVFGWCHRQSDHGPKRQRQFFVSFSWRVLRKNLHL